MDNLQDLKQQAQTLERGGQLEAALDLYDRLLQDPDAESDAILWIRAGDLGLKLGREDAADRFARAVDLLADAGRPNLALAMCQRILRADPARSDFLLRFGELSAEQGYGRDAQHGYVEYAARMEAAGDLAAARGVLRDYLRSFPDDAAVRRRLQELGGEPPAKGPAAPPVAPEPEDDAEPAELESDLDLLPTLGETREAPEVEVEQSLVPTASPEAPVPDEEVRPLEGLEPTRPDDAWEEPDEAEAEVLPLLGSEFNGSVPLLDPLDGEEAPEREPEPAEAEAEATTDGQEDESEPLPLLGLEPVPAGEPEEVAPTGDPLDELRERVAADPGDLDARGRLVERLESAGETVELAAALDAAHPAFASAGRFAEAASFAARLARLRPADLALHRAWVEYAQRAGDRAGVVDAQLALARRLEADLQVEQARDIYQRVLQLDPTNPTAHAALASVTPAARSSDDYIDFGALVLSDESEDRTRFQVAVGDPSGDEDSDFAEILDLFRQKVSESLDPKDVASHYDLGLAFKEMGLLDDAIAQFQGALRAGAEPLATLEMLGECFVEKGEPSLATRVLERAETLPGVSEPDLVGIHYWLGRCSEAAGEPQRARGYYERVAAVDLGFRDAASRLDALRSG